MLAIKAHYHQGRIEFIEPMPTDILSAELNIIVIPLAGKTETAIPADEYMQARSSEEEFKQIGLSAFFDTEDDCNVDWEDYFGLK